jgi:hypothetical protein
LRRSVELALQAAFHAHFTMEPRRRELGRVMDPLWPAWQQAASKVGAAPRARRRGWLRARFRRSRTARTAAGPGCRALPTAAGRPGRRAGSGAGCARAGGRKRHVGGHCGGREGGCPVPVRLHTAGVTDAGSAHRRLQRVGQCVDVVTHELQIGRCGPVRGRQRIRVQRAADVRSGLGGDAVEQARIADVLQE